MLRFICIILMAISCAVILSRCATVRTSQDGPPADAASININSIPNAVPVALPLCKYGNMPTYEVFGKIYHVLKTSIGYKKKGIASWYGTKFNNQRTSCGEPYDLYAMTAASKTLPLPTFVKVTNLQNGRQIIVKVNDRGPFADNRIIDLSYVAARKLGMTQKGTALVEVEAINPQKPSTASSKTQWSPAHTHNKAKIYLQMGAFKQQANAKALVRKLKSITRYTAVISQQHASKGSFYVVRLGPLPNVDTADALSDTLKQAGYPEPLEMVA